MRQQYRDRGVWSHHIITLARMRELHIEIEYGTGARSYILKWCQETHFNYCNLSHESDAPQKICSVTRDNA